MSSDQFLGLCKSYYLQKKIPVQNGKFSLDKSDSLVKIALSYFEKKEEKKFIGFIMEYHYLVDLWAAHLLLEHGAISQSEKTKAINIIKLYSKTPINKTLAKEEQKWLEKNLDYYTSNG